MKNMNNLRGRNKYLISFLFLLFFAFWVLIFAACTHKPEPYSILEFTGTGDVSNYSKSFLLLQNKSDSVNPTAIIGTNGDLIACDEKVFVYNDTFSQNRFIINNNDSVLYVNDKITSIDIPNNDNMIPWFNDLEKMDLSALQFISFDSKVRESYLPLLTKLAEKKPDAGLYYTGGFADMAELLRVFKPRYIASPYLVRSDFDMLSKLTGLEILMVSFEDSVINDPLPALPSLKQIFVSNMGEDIILTNDLLVNNRQIERLIIQKTGTFDFAVLKPLENLKELVVSGAVSVVNFDLINNHKKLEVLSITGDELVFNPALIRLPDLRWIAFPPNMSQAEFSSFIDNHPHLEVIEIIENSKINDLQTLSKLSLLCGLTITDSVTDITSVKTLTNLKYLSLPDKFLSDTSMKAELKKSLPNTRISANEGFCLGSGWLLLLIPLVLAIRFLGRRAKQPVQKTIKS
jgi:hypothetical protein